MNKKKKRIIQERSCIFCNNRPLTEEEVWPFWIRKIFPKTGDNKYIKIDSLYLRKKKIGSIKGRRYNGHFSTRTLKIVCAKCNNEWMSRIEDKAKCIISPLIENTSSIMRGHELKIIAKWVVLRTIIVENLEPDKKIIPNGDITFFYKTRKISHKWHIWIGKREESDGNYTILFDRKNAIIQSAYDSDVGKSSFKNNLLSVTFTINGFLIYAVFANLPILGFNISNRLNEKLVKVHPLNPFLIRFIFNEKVNWDNVPTLTDDDYMHLQEQLDSYGDALKKIKARNYVDINVKLNNIYLPLIKHL